ncbi:MAG: HAD hydrolase-like protein, partial [Halobacteriales archaeon]|nr:HAD hydrolase-like protein [Halobacteriales archaeon]
LAHGAHVDAFYHCPHPPEAGCKDRKPGIGMLQRAARDHELDLRKCALIGDRVLDVETARNAGGLAVMVPSERGRAELAAGGTKPDHIAGNFRDAAAWVRQKLKA